MRNLISLKNEILEGRLLFLLIVLGIVANLSTNTLKINASINDRILFITFLALVWYAWETKKLKEEAIKQTEIEQKPVIMLYVRNLISITDDRKKALKREYAISDRTSYYLSLRNAGRGPAFDVEVKDESNIFMVKKYQCRFFAPEPKGDEQAIKLAHKDSSDITNYSELENATFQINCEDINCKQYKFQYKIISIEKQEVEFIK